MGMNLSFRRCVGLDALALGWMAAGLVMGAAGGGSARAQTSVAILEPSVPLLPDKFGEWKKVAGDGATPAFSMANTNQEALKECGKMRSMVGEYARGGRSVHIEAMDFGDRTGATSAYTLLEQPGMTVGNELGTNDAVGGAPNGGGVVLFTAGSVVVLANFPGAVVAGDVAGLRPLAGMLPKINGNRGVAPLLPRLVPAKGLVAGSVRYALGPATYAAEGGVLRASSLEWEKEPEVVTARYEDARGKETLTALLYPTPAIAATVTKTIEAELPEVGARLGVSPGAARVRREGPMVLLAAGSFAADEAQRMVENVHLRQMTFNQDVQPTFHIAAVQTFSLLTNIAILSGVLMAAAVLLGLFLGVGRATFRVMRGKPAALEPEFLSLHLSPQSKPAQFSRADSGEGG